MCYNIITDLANNIFQVANEGLSTSLGSSSLKMNAQRIPFTPDVDLGCPDTQLLHIPLF